MSCEHPNCSNSIYSICKTHCHWSLCQQHFRQHQKSLRIDFQNQFENLSKIVEEFSKNVQEKKQNFDANHRKNLRFIEENYREKIVEIENKLTQLRDFKDQYQEKFDYLENYLKVHPDLLTENHFRQFDSLFQQLNSFGICEQSLF